MKLPSRPVLRWLFLLLAAVLGACATGPQVPTIRLERAAVEVPNSEMRWQQADPVAAGVRVWRGPQELRPVIGMQLQVGDVVETGPRAAAVIRFSASGTTVLDVATRVRIGSLEVVFGRVFANVRGLFQTSSETVLAGVSGTRYVFQVGADRQTRVSVLDGEVTCAPRQGSPWTPVRLRAGEGLAVTYGPRGTAQRTAVDQRELRDAAEWANQVSNAPVEGFCCVAPGRVERGWSNRCGGNFAANRSIAEGLCQAAAPPREPIGYCCNDGLVQRGARSQCGGRFYEDESSARRVCQASPPPPPPAPASTPPSSSAPASAPYPMRRGLPSVPATRAPAPPPAPAPLPSPPSPPVLR